MNWLMGKGLKWVGGKFDGYKTKIGGFGLILLGVIGIVNFMWPDTVPGCPVMTLEESIGSITGGCIALGIGSKIDKNTAAVKEASSVTKIE